MNDIYPFIPYAFQQPESPEQTISLSPVPSRIKVALQFLQNLTNKTTSRVVVLPGDQVSQVEGQVLSTAEKNAQATACNVINDYFLGKFKPDSWEKLVLEDMRRDVEEKDPLFSEPGRFMQCFACFEATKPDCIFCRGLGKLIVYPYAGEGK